MGLGKFSKRKWTTKLGRKFLEHFWRCYHRTILTEMNDILRARSHPQRLSKKTLHLYQILLPPNPEHLSATKLCINTTKDLNVTSHYYWQLWIHCNRKPARMGEAWKATKLSKLKEFYLPGPDGYGCVPVIIYSSSCPKKQ